MQTMESKIFFHFEIIINVLALPPSFEYLCYGSTTNILIISVRGATDLMSKVSHRVVGLLSDSNVTL